MSERTDRGQETEGRRGSRIDVELGGRYLGIPRNGRLDVSQALTQCPGNRVRYTPILATYQPTTSSL